MRLNDFETVEEVVDLGITEFKKRATAPTMNWMPSRQNVYTSQCQKYSDMLLKISKEASNEIIISSGMNPSQFIKSAQDFQLAARMSKINKETLLATFMKLANIGMAIKRHYFLFYAQKAETIELISQKEFLIKGNQLNALLRAFSEAVYFDDHTVSGEFYGGIEEDGKEVVIRSYKRLCPSDFWDGFEEFPIQRIETYSSYDRGKVDFDCLGNIQYVDQIRPEIYGFYAECYFRNGTHKNISNLSELNSIIEIIENQLKVVLMYFFSLTPEAQGCMLLKSAYYAFKPILDRMGYDWHPSNKDIKLYLNSLSDKACFDKVSENRQCSEEEYEQLIRKIVDPRV